jgi:hypothetical protein
MPLLIFGFKIKFLHIEQVFLHLQLKCYSMFAKKMVTLGPVEVNGGSWQLVTAINGERDGLTLCE